MEHLGALNVLVRVTHDRQMLLARSRMLPLVVRRSLETNPSPSSAPGL
jgi:hypothetical protein